MKVGSADADGPAAATPAGDQFSAAFPLHSGAKSLFALAFAMTDSMWVMHGFLGSVWL